eukprot:28874_1
MQEEGKTTFGLQNDETHAYNGDDHQIEQLKKRQLQLESQSDVHNATHKSPRQQLFSHLKLHHRVFIVSGYLHAESQQSDIWIPPELFQIILLYYSHSCAFPSSFPFEFNGLLEVRTNYSHPWSFGYFEIHRNVFFGAHTSLSTKLETKTSLGHAIITRPSANSIVFQAIFGQHSLYFRASSVEQCTKWVSAMEKAVTFNIKDIFRFRYTLSFKKTQVVAAKHRETSTQCAIKILDKRNTKRSALKQQLNLLKDINNSCVVHLFETIETSQYLYLVMEQCEGYPLLEQLVEMSLQVTKHDCCNIMHQIASAVEYMHQKGIVLKSLKPHNILCTHPQNLQRVKIAIYGISNAYKHPSFMVDSYFAPEILFNKAYDHTADYWNVGIIMYVLLSGCVAFETDHDVMHCDVSLEAQHWSHVPLKQQNIVRGLLSISASKRATCQDILNLQWTVSLSPTIERLRQSQPSFRTHSFRKRYTPIIVTNNRYNIQFRKR